MTSQLSKGVKTHIMLTYAGAKHFITAEQELALRNMDDKSRVYTDKGMIRVNTIKEIMPIEKYYLEHPEERPYHDNYTYKPEERIPYSAKRHFRALTEIRKGFLKYWEGKELNKQGKRILECMDKRIKNFKIGDKAEPGKVFFGIK